MKYIVTGGAGFIGHHIVNKLISQGHEVFVIDNLSTGTKTLINKKATFWEFDITEEDAANIMAKYFKEKEIDIVFHTAALARVQLSIENPILFDKVNIGGTLNVLLASHKANIKRVVYSASSSAYGNTNMFPTPESALTNPISPYAVQKFVGEQYCKMFSEVYKLDTVSLRYFNIYGENQPLTGAYRTIIGIFGEQYKNNKPLTITNDGKQRRDFTYVGDVVSANLLAAHHPKKQNGEMYNVGHGNSHSINKIAEMFDVKDIVWLGKVIEPFETLADNSKIKNVLGWNPVGDITSYIQKFKIQLKL